jgi:hypothetical protein
MILISKQYGVIVYPDAWTEIIMPVFEREGVQVQRIRVNTIIHTERYLKRFQGPSRAFWSVFIIIYII